MTTPDKIIVGSPNFLACLRLRTSRTLRYAIVMCLVAAPVRAELMPFEGTVSFNFLAAPRTQVRVTGTGVADVNKGGPDITLNTLDIPAGIGGSVPVPVTDPEVSGTIPSLLWDVRLGGGSLGPFASSSSLTRNTLPIHGSVRACVVFAGCASSVLLMPFSQDYGPVGIGVGGSFAPQLTRQAAKISIEAAPWTLGTAFVPISTSAGSVISIPSSGYVHGPLSFSGSAALAGGEIKLVTPVVVQAAEGIHPFTSFARIHLRFVPEPSVGLLLLSGVVGLLLLGRGRITPP